MYKIDHNSLVSNFIKNSFSDSGAVTCRQTDGHVNRCDELVYSFLQRLAPNPPENTQDSCNCASGPKVKWSLLKSIEIGQKVCTLKYMRLNAIK
jgi:hypothetical protein